MVPVRQENDPDLIAKCLPDRSRISYQGSHIDEHNTNDVVTYIFYEGGSIFFNVIYRIIFHSQLDPYPLNQILRVRNIIIRQAQVIHILYNMMKFLRAQLHSAGYPGL